MWGCLFARVVAVPVCPPDPTRLQHTLPHFNRIVADCGAVAILTDRTFHMVRPTLHTQFHHVMFTCFPAKRQGASAEKLHVNQCTSMC